MSRSNFPLALSVVTLTVPGNIEATVNKITAFDDAEFGFNHNQTWAAMPYALRGELRPHAVATSFARTPKRVQQCIVALCELGLASPRDTKRFADYPDAGIKTVESIEWDPEVSVRVKATCWYVKHGRTIIPILQPRKAALEPERVAVYIRLARQAYCQGDWIDALIEPIDLSGEDSFVTARALELSTLPAASDKLVSQYVQTFVEAKKAADKIRQAKTKSSASVPMAHLLGLDD